MSHSQLVTVVKMLQKLMAETRRQLEELTSRVDSGAKGTGDIRSRAQVARGMRRDERVVDVSVGRKTVVVVRLGTGVDPDIKARTAKETLQASRATIGDAVLRVRRLPNRDAALTLAAGREEGVLRSGAINTVFGHGAQLVRGGLSVIAKNISHELLHTLTEAEVGGAIPALSIRKKEGPRGRGTIVIRVPGITEGRQLTTDGLRLRGERYPCEPFEPAIRAKQCFRCWQWGHIGSICHNPARCGQCGQAPHRDVCIGRKKCVNCQGDHPAVATGICPVSIAMRAGARSAWDP